MNILYISDVYFPRINGVSTSINTCRNHLLDAGHRVVLIAPDYPQGYDDDNDIIRISSRKIIFDPEDRLMKLSIIKGLLPHLETIQFDVIHIQTPFVAHYAGRFLSTALKIPCVVTYHTFFEEYLYHYIPLIPKRWLQQLAKRFTRQQCNEVDHIIVPSSAIDVALNQYGVTTARSLIPTGIEIEQFNHGQKSLFKKRYAIDEDRPVLLHVGRVAYEKNIGFLIQMLTYVWQEIPEILLIIAGEGPALKSLKKMSRKLGLQNNIRFIGYQDRMSGLNDCYASGDIFVFSSSTETQGLVLLEAMACCVPIVSTAVLGTRDILIDCPGAIIAEQDELDFAKKVIKILDDDILRKKMSNEAFLYAHQWSAHSLSHQVLKLYQDMTGSPQLDIAQQDMPNHVPAITICETLTDVEQDT